mgnify:CR=1 FL=1
MADESYPEDLGVVLVATGGLSHQVHGERCGFNDPAWDARFLDFFEKEPEWLLEMTHADYARLGGVEGAEVIIAPGASEEAIKIVTAKKNLRLLLAGGMPDPRADGLTVKSVAGGLLVQSRDNAVVDEMQLKTVTKRAPTEAELHKK